MGEGRSRREAGDRCTRKSRNALSRRKSAGRPIEGICQRATLAGVGGLHVASAPSKRLPLGTYSPSPVKRGKDGMGARRDSPPRSSGLFRRVACTCVRYELSRSACPAAPTHPSGPQAQPSGVHRHASQWLASVPLHPPQAGEVSSCRTGLASVAFRQSCGRSDFGRSGVMEVIGPAPPARGSRSARSRRAPPRPGSRSAACWPSAPPARAARTPGCAARCA